MTVEEIQEEVAILSLACAQLGQELVAGRVRTSRDTYRKLGVVVRKLDQLEEAAKATAAAAVSTERRDIVDYGR